MLPLPPSQAFLKLGENRDSYYWCWRQDRERERAGNKREAREGDDGNECRTGRGTKGVPFLLNMVYKRVI